MWTLKCNSLLILYKPIFAGETAVSLFISDQQHITYPQSQEWILRLPSTFCHHKHNFGSLQGPFGYSLHIYTEEQSYFYTEYKYTKVTEVLLDRSLERMQNDIFINSMWSCVSPQLLLKLTNFTII